MNRTVDYPLLHARLSALTEGIPYEIANLANAAALLWETLPEINWAGFYKMVDREKLPASGSRLAGVSAARRWRRTEPSWCRMCTNFRAISPATALPIRKLWYPSM